MAAEELTYYNSDNHSVSPLLTPTTALPGFPFQGMESQVETAHSVFTNMAVGFTLVTELILLIFTAALFVLPVAI